MKRSWPAVRVGRVELPPARELRVSPDGRLLVALGVDGRVRVAHLGTGAAPYEGPEGCRDVALTAAFGLALCGDHLVRFELLGGRTLAVTPGMQAAERVAVGEGGALAVTWGVGGAELRRVATGREVGRVAGPCAAAAFDRRDAELRLGGEVVRVVRSADLSPLHEEALDGPAQDLAAEGWAATATAVWRRGRRARDGGGRLSAVGDGAIVWGPAGATSLLDLDAAAFPGPLTAAAALPDGRRLAIARPDAEVEIVLAPWAG